MEGKKKAQTKCAFEAFGRDSTTRKAYKYLFPDGLFYSQPPLMLKSKNKRLRMRILKCHTLRITLAKFGITLHHD